MTFGAPVWFAALGLLPLLVLLFWRGEVRRRQVLPLLVAPRLQPELAGSASPARRRLSFALLLAGLALVILALTRPRYGEIEETHPSVGRDIILAIDTSRSMLANDLTPTRLARAKLAAEDLVSKLHGDRVGLVAFAGNAFLQAPLTVDYPAMLAAVRELDTNIIPVGGTNLAEAIRCAADAFGKGESDQRALIIITDGEELEEDGVKAAREAAGTMRIFTIGAGSPAGTVIALPAREGGGTEYVKTPEGQIVKSSLDEPRLRAVAEAAGGFYVRLQNGPAEMETIVRGGLDAMTKHQAENVITRRPLERYRWPLAAGLVFLGASLLPGERRRVAPIAAGLLLLSSGAPAQAKNEALEAYDRHDYRESLRSFEDQLERRPGYGPLQFDAGAAAFQAGEFDKAADYFSRALTTKDPTLRDRAEYNLADTLLARGAEQKDREAKLQDLNNAVQHFDQVLRAQPQHADAAHNRALAQQLIAMVKQEPPPPPSGSGKSDKKEGEKKEGKEAKEMEDASPGDEKEGFTKDPNGKTEGVEKQSAGKEGRQGEPESIRSLQGKIADKRPAGAPEDDQKAEQQAKEDAEAAKEGKMTPTQALTLLESLKSADDRVSLLHPGQPPRRERIVRDW